MRERHLLSTLWCLCAMFLLSCNGSRSPVPTPPRQATDGALSLEMTTAPTSWEFLPFGQFQLAGTIQTMHGLNPELPCQLRIIDVETQMTVDVTFDPDPVTFPNTVIPLEGGPFVIDAIADYRLGEGLKLLQLQFFDTQNNSVAWVGRVHSGPLFPEISNKDMALARQNYGLRLLPLISEYRAMLEAIMESGAYTASIGQHLQYDLVLARQFEETFTEALIVHPDQSNWDQLAATMRSQIELAEEIGAPLSLEEQVLRQRLAEYADSWAMNLETGYDLLREEQWYWGSATPPPIDDSLRWQYAWCRNIFPTVSLTRSEAGYEYQAQIQTNTGLIPPPLYGELPAYTEPIADTWSTNPPVFSLTVSILDTDEDGILDTMSGTGHSEGTSFEDLLNADPIPHFGHPLTYLGLLQYSRYVWTF
ncbi:MAG: hypothetical protein GEEBNDBF_01655 [bacterium]|nr:hypothetical protein [bacterium]